MKNKDLTSSIYAVKSLDEAKDKLEEYQDIFNSLPIGIYRTKVEDGKFLKANPECANILGYKNVPELLRNSKSGDFYWDEADREKFIQLLKDKDSIHHYELPLKDASGNKKWVAITARLNKDKGYLEGSIMDITEQKVLEEELAKYKDEESQRLSKLNSNMKKRVAELDKILYNGHEAHEDLL